MSNQDIFNVATSIGLFCIVLVVGIHVFIQHK